MICRQTRAGILGTSSAISPSVKLSACYRLPLYLIGSEFLLLVAAEMWVRLA